MENNVLDYLENVVKEKPDNIAIISDNDRVSFLELRDNAKKIGSKIITETQAFNQPILVAVERSHKSIIGFMGVLYSGNYYVPVDINSPKNRLEFMINQLNPAAIIHLKENDILQQVAEDLEVKTFMYDDFFCKDKNSVIDDQLLFKVRENVLDINPCYVLYTSGSTGNPKGVVISHRMVRDLADWLQSVLKTESTDVIGNQTPFFFDASVKDIYQMLKTGATLVILKPSHFTFTKNLIEYLNKEKVSIVLWASSAVAMVSNSGILKDIKPEYLRIVTFAGEQLFTKTLNDWMDVLPNVRYINLYGPTEVTVDSLYYEVDRRYSNDEIIPLGKACFNKEAFLLNENNEVITDGIGEIAMRGTGVGLGYFGDFEKTSEVYIQNPNNNLYRDIIYKTGDLGYYNEDGLLIFASRKDNQIKLHGHRIELGEIEFALSNVAGVELNACIYDKNNSIIVAFYSGEEIKRKDINKQLISMIPKYMIPSKYTYLPEMPINNNGKVDRKKLEKML